MRQISLAEGRFEKYRKPTRREQFLAEMCHGGGWCA
jgi:hypothetical protein